RWRSPPHDFQEPCAVALRRRLIPRETVVSSDADLPNARMGQELLDDRVSCGRITCQAVLVERAEIFCSTVAIHLVQRPVFVRTHPARAADLLVDSAAGDS